MNQNNGPERIWIKPCDPCENPYDYYVCDPRYLDGRETSYVKSIVSCAGCGGGLKRQSGQFVCRDCGKAETVQEVLARADRAAPLEQVRTQIANLSVWAGKAHPDQQLVDLSHVLAILDAAPTDSAALVEKLRRDPRDWSNTDEVDAYNDALDDVLTVLASREAPPFTAECPRCGYHGGFGCYECTPPACQQEAVTEKALLQRAVDLIKGDLTGSEWKRACNAFVKDALRALKGSDNDAA